MKVALVHEFLTQLGGAERVLESFHELFPEAPVYTLVHDPRKTGNRYAGWDIRTSFLQKLPGMPGNYKWYLPLMPRAIESFDFSDFDLVLSDSSAFAKGIITKKPTVHICYCHTPTRYLWEVMDEYVAALPYNWLVKIIIKPYLKHILKPWDMGAAAHPDFLTTNSKTVQERIKKYYNRDSEIIYPPVDTKFFRPLPASGHPPQAWGGVGGEVETEKNDYYLTASRLEPYKKIDLVIKAFSKMNLPLVVAGDGTDRFNLEGQASPNIKFLGRVSDEKLKALYGEAKAFIFPALEDAGIMILESLACGTPVIGFNAGGTTEFITDGETGILFREQSVDAIGRAVTRFENMSFDSDKLRQSVLKYDKEAFKERILNLIGKELSRASF